MRILHVTTFLQGGAGRIIADLAIAQHQSGHDVHIVADAGGEPGYSTYGEYLSALASAGVAVTLLHSTFKRDLALNTQAALDLQRVTDAWPPDIVHAHATTPALVARLAGVGCRPSAGFLHTMHGWGIAKTAEQVVTDIALLELADAVVTPSAAAARTLGDAGLTRGDVHVIPYGIDAEPPGRPPDAADVETILRVAQGRRIAICIGTIGERKNQRLLIDALATGDGRDVVAVFLGDGEACSLHDRARALGVANRVVVLGHRPEASRYLSIADVMVLPSRNEGLPLAVLEALRAGVPSVVASIPEMAEAIADHKTGFLFEPDNPEALARGLRHAFNDTTRRVSGEQLRKHFQARYTSDRMLRSYDTVYESVSRTAMPTPESSREDVSTLRAAL